MSATHAQPVSAFSQETTAFLERPPPPASGWRIAPVLEETGMPPLHAERVLSEMQALHGELPPDSLAKEIDLARGVLRTLWDRRKTGGGMPPARAHVFVGAPGVGKTTALCKWLAQTVLVEGQPAEVWRLDGRAANTAESLSIYGDILGVPVERLANPAWSSGTSTVLFIDLPGINPADPSALEEFARNLKTLPPAELHLIVSASYDTRLLLTQIRSFSSLPITDLIVTHLDEEQRWGKLWALVLGTAYKPRFLSAGQNVPGIFEPASAERILTGQFRRSG